MNNQQKQPFDPWTATEEEAVKEDQIRANIKENLLAERRRLEAGSDGWFELQYKLAPILIEAIRQRKAAIRIKKYREKADRLGELKLLAIMQEVMNFKLIAPDWLAGEFSRRLNPILLGQKADFQHWKTKSRVTARKSRAEGIPVRLFQIVEELRKQGFTTGKNDKNNVWKPAAKKIESEFDVNGYSPKSAYIDYYDILKMLPAEEREVKKKRGKLPK